MELIKKDIVFPDVPHNGVLGGKTYDMQGNRIYTDLGRTSWKSLWGIYCNQWRHIVDEYEAAPGDFYAAWQYLDHHPAFWGFRHGSADPKPYSLRRRLHLKHLIKGDGIRRCLNITVVKVNAETRSTEDPGQMETEVWIELGRQSWPQEINPKDPETLDSVYNDYLLSTGGPTVEVAILRAAHNVWEVYGNDRRVCDAPYNKMAYITVLEPDHFDELMKEHGDDGEINRRVQEADRRINEIVYGTEMAPPARRKART